LHATRSAISIATTRPSEATLSRAPIDVRDPRDQDAPLNEGENSPKDPGRNHGRSNASSGDHRGWFRRPERRASAEPGARAGDVARPPEPSPVPALALPGGDGGAESERHR